MPATIVEIDAKSLAALGRWPWPRSTLAELVARVATMQPAVVGIDILMPEPDPLSPERLLRDAGARAARARRRTRRAPYPRRVARARDGRCADRARRRRHARADRHAAAGPAIRRAGCGRGCTCGRDGRPALRRRARQPRRDQRRRDRLGARLGRPRGRRDPPRPAGRGRRRHADRRTGDRDVPRRGPRTLAASPRLRPGDPWHRDRQRVRRHRGRRARAPVLLAAPCGPVRVGRRRAAGPYRSDAARAAVRADRASPAWAWATTTPHRSASACRAARSTRS